MLRSDEEIDDCVRESVLPESEHQASIDNEEIPSMSEMYGCFNPGENITKTCHYDIGEDIGLNAVSNLGRIIEIPKVQERGNINIEKYYQKTDAIVVTSASKAFPVPKVEIPEHIVNAGILIISPPPAEIKPLDDALRSPVKTRVSVMGDYPGESNSRSQSAQ
ncbi:hypothetical protein KUTeg_021750 [Tegillarca granosa]|uniref:Uncharacterized protein n=1 Tax=Tegillarca granosa TaxID=220873 RepID=A0ABQ9E494_TEGGR|nr:hypothetical protein KUTeg_021750 [Tegillarca granosa]